ncbi:MAG: WhiB family transcriptional regulator [Actinomycetes bacterium]
MANIGRLPAPLAEHWDWQQQGACREVGSDNFFAPPGERPSARLRRETKAKAVCATCTVREACLSWSLKVREPYGVWGGATPDERLAILNGTAGTAAAAAS